MKLVRDYPAPETVPTGNDLIDRIADGEIIVERGILQKAGLFEALQDTVFDAVGRRFGQDRRAALEEAGPDRLHDHFDMPEIVSLFLDVRASLDRDWRSYTPRICRTLFGGHPMRVIGGFGLRLLVPESVSAGYENLTKPYGGLMTPASPHRDSWGGTPMSAINVWLSLTAKDGGNGLYMHPECWRRPVRRRRPYVVDPDESLGTETVPAAAPGDAILFGAHHIHASHPNRSGRTQLLVAFKATPAAPRYAPEGKDWAPYVRADRAGGWGESVDRLSCRVSAAYLRHLGLLPARWWRDPVRRQRRKRPF